MSEIEKEKEKEKYKEIYNSNIITPSTNHSCGIVIEDNKAYKCPPSKFCNYLGLCENVECAPYGAYGGIIIKKRENPLEPDRLEIDISKFDGSDILRNNDSRKMCKYTISTDGKCGLDNNNTKCPDGQCCSMNGTCGYDKDSCLPLRFRNTPIAQINKNYYSNYYDVDKFKKEFIKEIGNKYIGNKNFEKSTNKTCGIDLINEKIIKCSDNECCNYAGKCTEHYDFCNKYSRYENQKNYQDLKDLSLNLLNGDKFNEEYNKWINEKINNNLSNNTNIT